MKFKSGNSWSGFTLIELLISTTVGLVILAAVMAVGSRMLQANSSVLKGARLNQDLTNLMQVMSNEIRRAGYTGLNFNYAQDEDVYVVSNSCILYSYDRNGNGTIENIERNGFRFDSEQIKIRESCNPAGGTDCVLDCDQGNWQYVSDDGANNIISVVDTDTDGDGTPESYFSTTGSKCRDISAGTYWFTSSETSTRFPCLGESDTTKANLTFCADVDADTTIDPESKCATASSLPVLAGNGVEVRQVKIVLQGGLTTHGEQDVTKRIENSVKIANSVRY